MTNNAPDYKDNLVFLPQGDWSDTEPKSNTDRTQSSCDMVDKIEKLSKQLEIATKCLKQYADRDNWYNTYKPNSLDECPIAYKERWKKEYGYKQAEKALKKIKELKK